MKAPCQAKLPRKILRKLLAPAASFCLRRLLSYQDAAGLLKEIFIDAGRQELSKHEIDPTVSRISALTGIRRPDITVAIKADGVTATEDATFGNFATRLIGRWMYDKRFYGAAGKPRALTIVGDKSEFANLVHELSSDLNFRTILLELERIGVVRRERSDDSKEENQHRSLGWGGAGVD